MNAAVFLTHPESQRIAVEALRRRGHHATVVGHVRALSSAESPLDWELLVLGVESPLGDGMEILRRAKMTVQGRNRGILAVVGPSVPEWAKSVQDAGADDCLVGPPDPKELDTRLAKLEQKLRARRAGDAEPTTPGPWNVPPAWYRASIEGGFLEVSRSLAEMLGYDSREELLQVDLAHHVYPNPQVRESLLAFPEGDFHTVETDWKRKDGSRLPVRISAMAIRDEKGRVVQIEGVVEDVAQRTEVEGLLLAAIVHSPICTAVVSDTGRIVSVNQAAEQLTGYRAEDLPTIDACVEKLFRDPESRILAARARESISQGRLPEGNEFLLRRKDGESRLVQVHLSFFEGGLVAQALDVTDQRAAEAELRRKQRALRDVLELNERDRQLMAYEIHDGFCQQLAGAMMKLQVYQYLKEREPEEAGKYLDAGLGWLGQSITEARRLIGGMRPPVLDDCGVVAAVDFLVSEAAEDGGMKVLFNQNLGTKRLAGPLETSIFRIIQESVRNAGRYSKSDRVQIELYQRSNHIVLKVQDWGIGFDLNSVEAGHFGLKGIRERARLLGGGAVIQSAPGKGTRITVRLPLVERP